MGAAQHDTLPSRRQDTPGLEALARPSEDMLEFRRQFVIRMGWFDEAHADDKDRYDTTPSTIHFVNRNDEGEVLSGMRLTRLNTLDDSLSIEMLQGNVEMLEAAEGFNHSLDYSRTDVWDLTRLVHRLEGEPQFEESIVSLFALFGAGLAKTKPDEDNELVWVFTTTAPMKRLLDASGIKADVIAKGKIAAHDEQDSYFCVIRPVPAMQLLRDNQATYGRSYDTVNDGFQALSTHE